MIGQRGWSGGVKNTPGRYVRGASLTVFGFVKRSSVLEKIGIKRWMQLISRSKPVVCKVFLNQNKGYQYLSTRLGNLRAEAAALSAVAKVREAAGVLGFRKTRPLRDSHFLVYFFFFFGGGVVPSHLYWKKQTFWEDYFPVPSYIFGESLI